MENCWRRDCVKNISKQLKFDYSTRIGSQSILPAAKIGLASPWVSWMSGHPLPCCHNKVFYVFSGCGHPLCKTCGAG